MSTATHEPLANSINDACRRARLGRSFIYEEIGSGRLIARKAGRRTIILENDLQRWLAMLPVAKSGPEAE